MSGPSVGYDVISQEPVRAMAQGFDTVDLVLDLVVNSARHCRMRDEDDFADPVSAGHVET